MIKVAWIESPVVSQPDENERAERHVTPPFDRYRPEGACRAIFIDEPLAVAKPYSS